MAGRFTIEGWLASGGMAEVYVAEESLPLGVVRRVALKRIHGHLASDARFLSMFVDEARVASQLAHPGIIPVYDVVESDGEVLLVLDYVPGWDLAAVLDAAKTADQRMPMSAALELGRATAQTLAYVHCAKDHHGRALGIVHRDVTPSNLLVAEDGTVRLLDFGVAKAKERVTHTATSSIKGKMAYLAPEQASGGEVDGRTDLYALGLVLFEVFTGRRALVGQHPAELVAQAQAPSIPRARSLRPDLDPALEELLERMLHIEPSMRPKDATEVATQLEALGAGDSMASRAQALQRFVESVMATPCRPLGQSSGVLDRALLDALGAGALGEGTRQRPAAPAWGAPVEDTARSSEGAAATVHLPQKPSLPNPRPQNLPPQKRSALPWILGAAALFATLGALWASADRTEPTPVAVSLRAPGAFVKIQSTPKGARIKLEGIMQDELTPTVLQLPVGVPKNIELSLDDHEPYRAQITASATTTNKLLARLMRRAGSLSLRTKPPGAQVFLNGEKVGVTPLQLESLPRKPAQLRLELSGYRTERRLAPLDAQARVELSATLSRKREYGYLKVSSNPWARVLVDGKLVAESTPAMGIKLPVGTRRVVLTNPRLKRRWAQKVKIRRGKTTSLIVELKP